MLTQNLLFVLLVSLASIFAAQIPCDPTQADGTLLQGCLYHNAVEDGLPTEVLLPANGVVSGAFLQFNTPEVKAGTQVTVYVIGASDNSQSATLSIFDENKALLGAPTMPLQTTVTLSALNGHPADAEGDFDIYGVTFEIPENNSIIYYLPSAAKGPFLQIFLSQEGPNQGAFLQILSSTTEAPYNITVVQESPSETVADSTAEATSETTVETSETTSETTEDTSSTTEASTEASTTAEPTSAESTTAESTTAESTTAEPTTEEPTTEASTTAEPTSASTTSAESTTVEPTTAEPTTAEPTTAEPTTAEPTTSATTSAEPTNPTEDTTPATTEEPYVPNDCDLYFVPSMVVNPDPNLTNGTNWIQDINSNGQATFTFGVEDGSGVFVDVITVGDGSYALQLRQDINMIEGQEYRIQFVAKTTPERTKQVSVITDLGPDRGYQDASCGRTMELLTDEYQFFNICCTAIETSPVRLILEFGGPTFVGSTNDMYIQKFEVSRGALVLPSSEEPTHWPTGSQSTSPTSSSTTTTETASIEQTTDQGSSAGLSSGAVAAIIIVVVAVVIAIIIAILVFLKFRRDEEVSEEEMKKVNESETSEEETKSTSTETETSGTGSTGSGSTGSGSSSGSTGSSSEEESSEEESD